MYEISRYDESAGLEGLADWRVTDSPVSHGSLDSSIRFPWSLLSPSNSSSPSESSSEVVVRRFFSIVPKISRRGGVSCEFTRSFTRWKCWFDGWATSDGYWMTTELRIGEIRDRQIPQLWWHRKLRYHYHAATSEEPTMAIESFREGYDWQHYQTHYRRRALFCIYSFSQLPQPTTNMGTNSNRFSWQPYQVSIRIPIIWWHRREEAVPDEMPGGLLPVNATLQSRRVSLSPSTFLASPNLMSSNIFFLRWFMRPKHSCNICQRMSFSGTLTAERWLTGPT